MYRTITSSLGAAAAAAALAIGGAVLVATPAHAVTQHCDSALYPNKVELDGSQTTVDTGLAPGTRVCIKAGTSTVVVTVDGNGDITQNSIMNKPGNGYLGISYYAYGDCIDNPSTYVDECSGY
jgi:hypothetical protein